jgi:hypothetical protein
MRSLILYIPESITLNLDEPDLGHPDGRAIIARHHRQSTRKSMGFSRDNPAFACRAHIGGTNPGLYIKNIGGEWWAAHYESGACPSRRIPAPMSDEHKRQTDYWARAAEDAGWAVDLEHPLPTGTRPDALIFGTVLTGVEVQRSSMTAAGAITRTKRAAAAGVADVWFTGNDIHAVAGKLSPPWAHRVPTVGAERLGWGVLPPRGAALATGLRKLKAMKCTYRNWSLCPLTHRLPCGETHAIPEPLGLTVDEVAARFPAGELVSLRMRRNARSGDIFIVRAQDAALYQEVTGYRPPETTATPPKAGQPPGRVECANDQAQAFLPLYVPPPKVALPRAADAPPARGRHRKTGNMCDDCGYPMPDGTCSRQACRVARTYRAEGNPS